MAKLTLPAFRQKWRLKFADNTIQNISEATFREFAEDAADSLPSDATEPTTTYTADTNIIIGRLVARTATGIKHYDARSLQARHTLLGIALQSASPGGQVKVQEPGGLVTIPGWGLLSGMHFQAGADGKLASSSTGLSFAQPVGTALSFDSLFFLPSSIITLL